MDISILEGIGLSKGEIKIYLALMEFGSTKIGRIIEKSGMASSAAYNSINKLIEKGLVSYIRKGKVKFYQAVSPEQVLEFINEKKRRFMKILPELKQKQEFAREKQEAEIFEGANGISTMLNLLIENAKKGDEYLTFAIKLTGDSEEIRRRYFLKHDIKRKELGVVVRGLAPRELKEIFKKRKILKMKYTNYPIPANISIFKDKIALFSWGEKPIGYLMKSKQISDMFREFFERMWTISKN